MKVGIGVEGPSDKEFWEKVLHKHHRGVRFDIRNMKNRTKLISAAPNLLDSFRGLGYECCIILIDRDSEQCPEAVIDLFDERIVTEARKPLRERFLSIAVAVRELESWFIADTDAVQAVLPDAAIDTISNTDGVGAEGKIRQYWRDQYGAGSPNKIDFARSIAPRFDPARAVERSPSFSFFWNRLSSLVSA